jgi:hypothetical protein
LPPLLLKQFITPIGCGTNHSLKDKGKASSLIVGMGAVKCYKALANSNFDSHLSSLWSDPTFWPEKDPDYSMFPSAERQNSHGK